MPVPSALILVAWYALSSDSGQGYALRHDVYPRDTDAQATSTAQVAAPPRGKARNADQEYLRKLADHFEEQRTIVHAMMSTGGSHASLGSSMDLANWDGPFDLQQREAVALLQHDYREAFNPRARAASTPRMRATGDGEADERAGMQSLVAAMRQTVTLTDHFLPRLRRASTRDLARRVRASQVELGKKLGTMAGH